jgi:hypothetical protein
VGRVEANTDSDNGNLSGGMDIMLSCKATITTKPNVLTLQISMSFFCPHQFTDKAD